MPEFTNTRDEIGEQAALDGLVGRTLTEYNEDENVLLRPYAFYENKTIASVSFPNVTTVNSTGYQFQNASALQSANFGALTTAGQYMFSGCQALKSVNVSQVTGLPSSMLAGAPIPKLTLNNVSTFGYSVVGGFGALEVDISGSLSSIGNNMLNYSYNLASLILRRETMVSLSSSTSLEGTSIAAANGWIYVPDSLVNTYKANTNWSAYANQIVPLSEYPKALPGETISDSWSEIFEAEANNTYGTKYSIGDTKFVAIGGIPVLMQIAALDGDVLANNSGTAKITWVSRGIIYPMRMNATDTTSGGWGSSELRSWLRDSVYPTIESTVRGNIKTVTKTFKLYSPNRTESIDDTIWIPSYREVGLGNNAENSGVIYSELFSSNQRRCMYAGRSNFATVWRLRSAYDGTRFRCVGSGGTASDYNSATASYGVVVGFCT